MEDAGGDVEVLSVSRGRQPGGEVSGLMNERRLCLMCPLSNSRLRALGNQGARVSLRIPIGFSRGYSASNYK